MKNEIIVGNCLDVLPTLPAESVQCVVTSPPYWGLRDYGIQPTIWDAKPECKHVWGKEIISAEIDSNRKTMEWTTGGQPGEKTKGEKSNQGSFCHECGAWRGCLGLEPDPELFVKHIVDIFMEVKRVLRPDGTLWLNLGDSYAASGRTERPAPTNTGNVAAGNSVRQSNKKIIGLKPKDLCGIPWRVAFALRADSWYLRSDIIWHKPNPMPESVVDRPTKSHEYLFLLAKSQKYFYDAEAVMEPYTEPLNRYGGDSKKLSDNLKDGEKNPYNSAHRERDMRPNPGGRNRRSVWTIPTQPYSEAHFATFPEALVKPCILAGTSTQGKCRRCGTPLERVIQGGFTDHSGKTESQYSGKTTAGRLAMLRQAARENGGEYQNQKKTLEWRPGCDCGVQETDPCLVLDPFSGSGTVGKVCAELARAYIGIELNPEYAKLRQEERNVLTMAL